MTVEELIIELESLPEDAEIRLAMQPSWPFEYGIGCVTEAVSFPEGDVAYLAEGPQLGYLPGAAREAIGW